MSKEGFYWITTSDKTFTLTHGENLLEALERTGHEVEYQCRAGFCGSCRLRITCGKVGYKNAPLAFLCPDEILPCCCIVRENISIDCSLRPEQLDLFKDDLFTAEFDV